MKSYFTANQRVCLKAIGQTLLAFRWKLPKLLSCQFLSATLEGVTIAILFWALNVLIGNYSIEAQPLPTWISTRLLHMEPTGIFFASVALAILAQILKAIFDYLSVIFTASLRVDASSSLYTAVSSQIMRFDYRTIGRYKAGVLAELLTGTERLTDRLIFSAFFESIRNFLLLLVYIATMTVISPTLTLVSAIIVAVIVLPTFYFSRNLNSIGRRYAKETLALGGIAVQYLNAPRLLRVFGQTTLAHEKMGAAKRAALRTRQKSEILIGLVTPLISSSFIIAMGLVLALGFVILGTSLGAFVPIIVTFLIISNRIKTNVLPINKARLYFVQELGLVESIGALLSSDQKTYTRTGTDCIQSQSVDIQFDSITFRHEGAKNDLFKDFSLSLDHGKTTAIVGPSGAGKSTLVDLLLGLYSVTDGAVLANGTNILTLDHDYWMSLIGVVDQEVYLLNGTLSENIAFGKGDATEQEIFDAAKSAHIDEFVNNLPDGYDTILGDRGLQLSGGQRQRVSIARALIRSPAILVFDEATSALDSESEQLIQDTLASLRDSHSIFVIAHRLSTIVDADHLVILEDGAITEQGRPNDLLSSRGRFYSLWRTQAGRQQIIE